MRKLRKITALIISAAMMITMASCGKEEKVDIRGRNTNNPFTATIERDDDKTTEEDGTGTSTTGPTTELTTEQVGDVDPEAEKAFKEFEDEYFKYVLSNTYLGYHYSIKDSSKFDVERPEATWGDTDWSDEAIEKNKKEGQEWMDKLKAIDRNGLSEKNRISYDIYMEDMEDNIDANKYMFMTSDFAPMAGVQANFANYFTDWDFYVKQDVDDYLALLEDTPRYYDGLLEFEAERVARGYGMSDASIDDVVEQCNTFVEAGENHFLIEVFDLHIDALTFLTDAEKTEYKARNKDIILNMILPEFTKIGTTIAQYKGKGNNTTGLAAFDGGKECYAQIMKAKTGSAKTPEEALEVLYNRYNEFMSEVSDIYMKDPEGYMYYVNNEGNLLKEADTEMTAQEVIDKLMVVDTAKYPAIDKIPYNVSFLDKPLETIMDHTLAYYRSPTLDDPTNNIIKVNGGHMEDLWATLAHEGFPGHMYAYNYFMTTNPSNLRALCSFLGYGEGWAKYVEYDSYSVWDFPDTDCDETVAKLMAIDSEINMLIMGIFDIEVNYNGWTTADASKWLNDNGMNGSAAQQIIDVVAGDPGLYQSYVLGYYEMKGLRDKAEQALGDKFDVVEFHRVILETGECQFDILERQVDKYIAENR
ncbi:MAG: DUF885 domain-containing protein [Eubacterium sp.]|nr:DUF885 domain-containing protein [Eubacterium sp.]